MPAVYKYVFKVFLFIICIFSVTREINNLSLNLLVSVRFDQRFTEKPMLGQY